MLACVCIVQATQQLLSIQSCVQESLLLLKAVGVDGSREQAQAQAGSYLAAPNAASSTVVATLARHIQHLYATLLQASGLNIAPEAAEWYAQYLLQQTRGQHLRLPDVLAQHAANAQPAPSTFALQLQPPAESAGLASHSRPQRGKAALAHMPGTPAEPASPGSSSTGIDLEETASRGCRMGSACVSDSGGTSALTHWVHSTSAPRVQYMLASSQRGQAASLQAWGESQYAHVHAFGVHVHSAPQAQPMHLWRVAFTSQCEHHMLPFNGTVNIAVQSLHTESPASHALIQDVVDLYCCRLQLQERITHQVADAMAQVCPESSVLVMVDAAHMCMVARGVEKHAAATVTTAFRGQGHDEQQQRSSMLEQMLASQSS